VVKLDERRKILKCSFCGKSQQQAKKVIFGPDAGICDECIDLCNQIIAEELGGPSDPVDV